MFIINSHALFHLLLEENLVEHQKVSKYYDHDCLQSFVLLLMFQQPEAATGGVL